MKAWITVAEAAMIARRGTSTIHRWIDQGLLVAKDDPEAGVIVVDAREVLAVESTRRRGRPAKCGKSGTVQYVVSDESAHRP